MDEILRRGRAARQARTPQSRRGASARGTAATYGRRPLCDPLIAVAGFAALQVAAWGKVGMGVTDPLGSGSRGWHCGEAAAVVAFRLVDRPGEARLDVGEAEPLTLSLPGAAGLPSTPTRPRGGRSEAGRTPLPLGLSPGGPGRTQDVAPVMRIDATPYKRLSRPSPPQVDVPARTRASRSAAARRRRPGQDRVEVDAVALSARCWPHRSAGRRLLRALPRGGGRPQVSTADARGPGRPRPVVPRASHHAALPRP